MPCSKFSNNRSAKKKAKAIGNGDPYAYLKCTMLLWMYFA